MFLFRRSKHIPSGFIRPSDLLCCPSGLSASVISQKQSLLSFLHLRSPRLLCFWLLWARSLLRYINKHTLLICKFMATKVVKAEMPVPCRGQSLAHNQTPCPSVQALALYCPPVSDMWTTSQRLHSLRFPRKCWNYWTIRVSVNTFARWAYCRQILSILFI